MSETITVNGKTVEKSEFSKLKEKLENKPGVKLVEVKPGVFKTQIKG